MQCLVQLRLSSSARPTSQKDGINLIEEFIFPILEQCKKLHEEKKILAGGPMSDALSLVLIVNAELKKLGAQVRKIGMSGPGGGR